MAIRWSMMAALVLAAGAAGETITKTAARVETAGQNRLREGNWFPYGLGFAVEDGTFVCDNGADTAVQRGAGQRVTVQSRFPTPIIAIAESKAEGVTGGRDSNYAIYLDIVYTDGEPLWGCATPFRTGTHDWQEERVVVFPEKPVQTVSMYLLHRGHGGKAMFRNPRLLISAEPRDGFTFDGIPVTGADSRSGFQVRDVAIGGDILAFDDGRAAGLTLAHTTEERDGATFHRVSLTDETGGDRAVTLYYGIKVDDTNLRWLADPDREERVERPREYAETVAFGETGNGRVSRYPFGAAAGDGGATAIGFLPYDPAFGRTAYNAETGELFLALDLALVPERPSVTLSFCTFSVRPGALQPAGPGRGFRAVLAEYVRLFPEAFRLRTPEQGLWMPFAAISAVPNWQDFGFKFKEGMGETAWDDAHGITTFRYTEPMTWWMRMPKETPRTPEAATAHAQALAETGNPEERDRARALLSSGYRDQDGEFTGLLRDEPWCDGAVWSMNSMPGIPGEITDFRLKWNAGLREKLYGPEAAAILDGEYIDSSEGYVTAELNYRRDHFAAARFPLVFSLVGHKPAIFRGLIAAEYIAAIAEDVHGMGKLMMANSTPARLWWLAPYLDVMGTETNWNHGGTWSPTSRRDLVFKRAICGPKPYCFLMNTDFGKFGADKVEAYMKRSLAYGMFPGFFSADASTGHYFTRPELFERDRPLFRKYVPLCKRVAEAGWRPVTGARADNGDFVVERFGARYLTVLNDGDAAAEASVAVSGAVPPGIRELVSETAVNPEPTNDGFRVRLNLAPGDVAVLDLAPENEAP